MGRGAEGERCGPRVLVHDGSEPSGGPRSGAGSRERPLRALLCTSDKRGVADFAAGLSALGWEVAATDGTAAALAARGLEVKRVSELTGAPTMLGGRLKTLHAPIFAGLLYRRGVDEDEAEVVEHGVPRVDLLACNFYRIAKPSAAIADVLQTIDIGGPAMVRAAAKNHPSVLVITDPADYREVLAALRDTDGNPSRIAPELRRRLALKAFAATRDYDALIVRRIEEIG